MLVTIPLAGHAVSGEDKVEGYAFVVFGDSRIPAYAPYDRNHKDEIDRLVSIIGRYAQPDSSDGFEADFDKETLRLERVKTAVKPDGTSRDIVYGPDGWPDVFVDRKGDEARVSLLASGQEWVYDNVVRELRWGAEEPENGPTFALHTGDLVYFGFQGKTAEKSPYWRDLNQRLLSRLPDGGPGELPARFFPALGNHETWGDGDIIGFRQMFPYLEGYGFNAGNRIYSFDHKNSRFIFLDSGTMNPKAPAEWYRSTPGYEAQMKQLRDWLVDAIARDQDHVFVTFHNPVFCRSGFGPLPAGQNPHDLLQSFTDRIDITVFNGHVHATEAYAVDGVRYFVAGGGGGEQNFSPNRMPEGYPEDLYWQGRPRKLDYNYLVVRVSGEDVSITLKRFRPNEFQPFDQVNLVPGLMK